MRIRRLKRPAVVDRLFPSDRVLLSLALVFVMTGACAQTLHAPNHHTPRYIGQIQAHTPAEIQSILQRLDTLHNNSEFPSSQPLALVLHGDEVNAFLRKNYSANRELVDLAARLDAFDAVDIQICETWMRDSSVSIEDLPAFVDTVPYGPAREQELLEDGFEYF